MTALTPEDRTEMLELIKRAHAWIDGLAVAGVSENVAVSAIHVALCERGLRAGGVAATVKWLLGQAKMLHEIGPSILDELNRAHSGKRH